MGNYRGILIIGIIEILIGSITLFSNLVTIGLSTNPKSPNVLGFVVLTGIASTLIGAGMLKLNKTAYQLLLYFSSVIVLSKILLFLNIIQLNGALETTVPAPFKRLVSIGYHCFIIYYLSQGSVRKIFHKKV